MSYLFLSIICSVSVGIILKIVRKNKNFAFFQMITWNYFFAGSLSYWAYKPEFNLAEATIPLVLFVSLILLLPSVFLLQANSIKYMGIVRTDIAQRLSLIISLSAAFFIFKEPFSLLKIAGLLTGLISIFLILSKGKTELVSYKWQYPVIVLISFGVIDVLFKQVALYREFSYTSSLFIIFSGAFIISVLLVLFQIIVQKQKFNIQNMYWGACLGLFNFGNILFYLKAHQVLHDNPSTVFACMNFGVIILGSMVGILFFKEKMSKLNYLGLALALSAILIITVASGT
ncbi:MAG: DMT family transporter [Flavobacteriaceae bacterium]|jgi:drug/metabolite transporter (DMT)-like permease|nr:DMT family transporter [Flavobacteriaceae bacterium]